MSVSDNDVAGIEAALLASKDVERVISLSVFDVADGPLVAAKISIAAERTMNEVSAILALAERRVLQAVPAIAEICIQPDVWLDPDSTAPTTSAIVMLSSD